MSKNADLSNAKNAKKDEFYTQLEDINAEMIHYEGQFNGKTILMNCDDPTWSNFWRYFHMEFKRLGLKKIIATHYEPDNVQSYKMEYIGGNDENFDYGIRTDLSQNGDFRSPECLALLEEADIVVTNPPFSLFREYLSLLMKNNKKFIIIGNVNAITYKEVFPLIRENKLWLGASIHSGDRKFYVPDDYPLNASGCGIDENGRRFIRVKGVRWYTNIDYVSRHTDLETAYYYSKKDRLYPELYPKYDNYNAINVDKTAEIPMDYEGVMGVPITFLDKYNPDQFDIVGGSMDYENTECHITKNYTELGYRFVKSDGVSPSNSGALRDKMSPKIPVKGKGDYSISPDGEFLSAVYGRIFIKRKEGKQ